PIIEKSKNENLDEYAIIVHGIKGSSRSICAGFAGDIAEALEKAAKVYNQAYVNEKTPELINTVQELISAIEHMLEAITSDTQKPLKNAPDAEALEKILEACKIFDMETVETVIKELESFAYENGGDLVHWLWENVQQFNVDEVIEKLAEYLEQLP
ncbi:MAG: Hpt domain-containing protein, partial [Defluviitaleaceae bacterium]|nr:Hpt domain-containing protein [Defluviitaleaceae bacterium]